MASTLMTAFSVILLIIILYNIYNGRLAIPGKG